MVISSNLGYLGSWLGSYFLEEKYMTLTRRMVDQDQQRLEIVWKQGLIVVELSKMAGKESRNMNMGKFNPTSQGRLSYFVEQIIKTDHKCYGDANSINRTERRPTSNICMLTT